MVENVGKRYSILLFFNSSIDQIDYERFQRCVPSAKISMFIMVFFVSISRLVMGFLAMWREDTQYVFVPLFVLLLYAMTNGWIAFYMKSNLKSPKETPDLLRTEAFTKWTENAFVLLLSLYTCIELVSRIWIGACPPSSTFIDHLTCNPKAESLGMPTDTLFWSAALTLLFAAIFKSATWANILGSWLMCFISFAASSYFFLESHDLLPIVFVYAPCTFLVLIEMRRRDIHLFFFNQEMQALVKKNKEMAREMRQDELRTMIANVAHDLKTPLSAFLTGSEFIGTLTADLKNNARICDRACASSQAAMLALETISETLTNIKSTNSFMTMTVNRCLDYTKASKGIQLIPHYESIDLAEALRLPLRIMHNLEEPDALVTIRLQHVEDNICSHLITDKIWLQENVLCLLSNASKYSFEGRVTICIRLAEFRDLSRRSALAALTALRKSLAPEADDASGKIASSTESTGSIEGANENLNGPAAAGAPLDSDAESLEGWAKVKESKERKDSDGSDVIAVQAHWEIAPWQSEAQEEANKIELLKDGGQGMGLLSHLSTFLVIEVEDHGIGIEEQKMQDLFNPFKQAQRLAGGTGLGLYSLAKRVEALRGLYGIENRRDGEQGSLIWFAVPYKPDAEMAAVLAASQSSSSGSASVAQSCDGGVDALSDQSIRCPVQRTASREAVFSGSAEGEASRILEGSVLSSIATTASLSYSATPSNVVGAAQLGELLTSSNSQQQDSDHSSTAARTTQQYHHHHQHHQQNQATDARPTTMTFASMADTYRLPKQSASARSFVAGATSTAGKVDLQQTGAASGNQHRLMSTNSLRILVVDDSATINRMTCDLLRSVGHSMDSAENGLAAVRKVSLALSPLSQNPSLNQPASGDASAISSMTQSMADTKTAVSATVNSGGGERTEGAATPMQREHFMYDLIFMDIQMPIMDGLEATRKIRELLAEHAKAQSSSQLLSASDRGDGNNNDGVGREAGAGEKVEGEREGPAGQSLSLFSSSSHSSHSSHSSRSRSHHRHHRHTCKIIGFSANSDSKTVEQALAAGVDIFLPKPFTLESFLSTLDKLDILEGRGQGDGSQQGNEKEGGKGGNKAGMSKSGSQSGEVNSCSARNDHTSPRPADVESDHTRDITGFRQCPAETGFASAEERSTRGPAEMPRVGTRSAIVGSQHVRESDAGEVEGKGPLPPPRHLSHLVPTQLSSHSAAVVGTSKGNKVAAAVNVASFPASAASDTVVLRVLAVDDSPLINKMSGRLLRALGHTVEFAENGAVAVRKVTSSFSPSPLSANVASLSSGYSPLLHRDTAGSRSGDALNLLVGGTKPPPQRVGSSTAQQTQHTVSTTGNARSRKRSPTASSAAGSRAAKIDDSKPFDLILMDMQMPIMDGLEATRRIRKFEQQQKVLWDVQQRSHAQQRVPYGEARKGEKERDGVKEEHRINDEGSGGGGSRESGGREGGSQHRPVLYSHRCCIIGLSANSEEGTKRAAYEAGVDAFLEKPFTKDSFEAILAVFESLKKVATHQVKAVNGGDRGNDSVGKERKSM